MGQFNCVYLFADWSQQAEERYQVIYRSIVWEEGEGSNGADCWQGGPVFTSLNRFPVNCMF